MLLKELSFINARNLSQKNIFFNPQTTIIVGGNGVGKTTILEAISYISTAKSFRKKHTQSIIKKTQRLIVMRAAIKWINLLVIFF